MTYPNVEVFLGTLFVLGILYCLSLIIYVSRSIRKERKLLQQNCSDLQKECEDLRASRTTNESMIENLKAALLSMEEKNENMNEHLYYITFADIHKNILSGQKPEQKKEINDDHEVKLITTCVKDPFETLSLCETKVNKLIHSNLIILDKIIHSFNTKCILLSKKQQ